MLASRIGRTLRSTAPALAVASLAAAGVFAMPAAAGESPPCAETPVESTDVPAGADIPCAEPAPTPPPTTPTTPTTTTTETLPLEEAAEPATMGEILGPAVPKPVVPSTPLSPATTTTATNAAKPTRAGTQRTPPSAGIFGGGSAYPPYNGTPKLSAGPYVFPVVGASSFSDTWGAARATVSWHHGVDIFAPLGSPIVAVADGTLFSVGWNTVGGQRLWLRDRQGNFFYYAHLSAFAAVAVNGAQVTAGTVIGFVGNTGDAAGTPYHLHFEVHPVSLLSRGYDGAVNPFSYVSAWQAFDHLSPGSRAVYPDRSREAAPPPGVILIGFTDISSASGLAPASLDRTLQERPALQEVAVTEALTAAPTTAASTRKTAVPVREDYAQIARSLDSEATQPARYSEGVWDALAQCESSGNWSTNTGNGFVGGLQFLPQTWFAHGGSAFAPSAHLATRQQQIAVAERVLDTQGWRAWPACSARLGLPAFPN